MSTRGPPSPPGAYTAKVAKRRANSCVPCRVSKSRCSGGIPCATCQKKRGKPRCWYRNVVSKDDEDSEQSKTSPMEQDQKEGSQGTAQQETEDAEYEESLTWPYQNFYGAFSLARCVDKFRSLSSADGAANRVIRSIQTTEVFNCKFNDEEKARMLGQAQQGQATKRLSLCKLLIADADSIPFGQLRILYHKFLDARQLLDAGMVAEAWSASASLVRDAELLGLEEGDGSGDTADRHADREHGRRIWWLLVDLDAQLSFLLGRRPLISPSHGVPRPTVDSSRQEEKDLLQNILDFSQYILEVLADVIPTNPASKLECHIEKEKLETYLARLQDLDFGFSFLPQNGKTDPPLWTAIAEHQFKVQLFLMVLNCQLVMSTAPRQTQTTSERRTQPSSKSKKPQTTPKQAPQSYIDEMIESIRRITNLFEYINALDPVPRPPWPRCFGVYCAASLLGIARLRGDIELIETDSDRIKALLKFFQGSLKRSPRSAIAQAAVMSLDRVLEDSPSVPEQQRPSASGDGASEPQTGHSTTPKDGSSQTTQASSITNKTPGEQPAPGKGPHLKRRHPATTRHEEELRSEKRPRYSVMPPSYEPSVHGTPTAWQGEQGPPQYSQPMSSFSEMSAASFHESSIQHSFDQASFAHSAATSFADEQLQYGGLGYANGHPDNGAQAQSFPFWMHPPMLVHPPMYHAGWQAMDPNPWMMADGSHQVFYAGPPNMPVDAPRQHDGNAQAAQAAGMNSFGQAPASAHEDVQARGNMAMPAENARGGHDAQPYATGPPQYQRLDHSVSSPIRDDSALPHQENAFGHAPPMDRRRSAADIRQGQGSTWAMEMPPEFANQNTMGDQREAMHRSQTPSRDALLSPVGESEPKSRRNSGTPRQIGRKGRPPPRSKQADMPVSSIDSGDAHGPRRRSIAHAGDVMMADAVSGGDPRAGEIQLEARTEQQQAPPVWANHAPPPGHGPPPSGSNMYSLDMAGHGHGHALQYQQDFNPHLPPRPIVTTGPFASNSGGHHWWAR